MSAAPLSSYSIGNSLTLDMLGGNIGDIAAAKGFSLTSGQHIRAATSLTTLYNLPADYDSASPGPFTTALPGNRWDAVSLQSYYGGRDGIPSTLATDLEALQAFISLAVSSGANANTRFCLYAPWPNIDLNDSASYSNLWLMSTANAPSEPTLLCRSYFQHLYPLAKSANPGLRLIPAGELIYVLDQKMRAGQLPGFSGAANLYRDGWHLNSIGRYIVSLEAFAVMFQKDPRGVPFTYDAGNPGIVPSPALLSAMTKNLSAIQQTVWEVVTADSAAWDSAPVTDVYPTKDTTTTLRGNPMMNGMAYIGGSTDGVWWGDPAWVTGKPDVNANCNIAYIRVTWTAMEPTEGNYCWVKHAGFKAMVAGLTNAGYRLGFRIMCQDAGIGGPADGTPKWVMDAIRAGGYNPCSTVNTNYPDLLNPIWQAKYKTFILALGAAFDNPDVTDYIDCNGTSLWGEGNPWLNGIPMDSRQETYFNWHLGVYTQAFQHVMLDHYNGALAQKFSVLPRADGFGGPDPSTWTPRSNEFYAYVNAYFPACPYVCEAWGFTNTQVTANNFLSDCLNVHANAIQYGYFPDYAATKARFIANVGYRLRPKTAVFPEAVSSNASMNISHVWSNDGVGALPNMNIRWKDAATGRGKYRVAFALFPSGSSVPSKIVVDPVPEPNLMVKNADQGYVSAIQWGVPPGGYDLATALVDTTKPLAPALKLAVTNGIQRNGWTVLGAVTVAAATAAQYTLSSQATEGGTISPSGALTVSSGKNQTFTIIPGYRRKIADVNVDGASVGTAASYTFSKVKASHTIEVTFSVDAAPAVWTGGGTDDTWIASANWTNGVTPLYYDENVIFAGATRLTPQLSAESVMDGESARTLCTLTFAGTAGSFVLGTVNNRALGLTGGMTNSSANPQTVNIPLSLGEGSPTFHTSAGDLIINAGISGSGGLVKTGSGKLTLNGANAYAGATLVNAGTLAITAWNALDSRTSVRIVTGGLLSLNFNGEQTVSSLYLNGILQVSGTWGAAGSGAAHASTLLTGTGVLRVIAGTGAYNWNADDGVWDTATANWNGLGTAWADGAGSANFFKSEHH